MPGNKSSFRKISERERRVKVSNVNRNRWTKYRLSVTDQKLEKKQVLSDHSYHHVPAGNVTTSTTSNTSVASDKPDLDHVIHEEHVFSDNVTMISSSNDWISGRRLVELDVLAQGLSACSEFTLPLNLSHTVGETRLGLGSLLHVICQNPCCNYLNKLPVGKRHKSKDGQLKIWDVNTKAVTGKHFNLNLTSLGNYMYLYYKHQIV
jgi:hypothetical protein